MYFDDIRKDQLQQLLWVITIGENSSDSKQMHKIGRGKPVGYGSVKITVDEIFFRELDKSSFSYLIKKHQYDDYMQKFDIKKHFDMKALSDFKTITNYSLTVCEDKDGQKREIIPISYPIAEREPKDENESSENLKAGHQWFTGNRSDKDFFARVLPPLCDDLQKLTLFALHGENFTNFEVGRIYKAKIKDMHTSAKNEDYIDFTVCGEKSDINLKFFPEEIRNDPQKAIDEHVIVKVKFIKMQGEKPIFYMVKD